MGFTGMKKWSESDSAADFAYITMNSVVKELAKEIEKTDNNADNTSPAENVALIIESFILPSLEDFVLCVNPNALEDIIVKTSRKLRWEIKQIEQKDRDKCWIKSITRMEKNCQKVLHSINKWHGIKKK